MSGTRTDRVLGACGVAVSASILAGVAGLAQANEVGPTQLSPTGAKGIAGHVYINSRTGERVLSAGSLRGDDPCEPSSHPEVLAWDSSATDPCLPPGFPQADAVTWIFSQVHSEGLGDMINPGAIGHWQDWMEVPAETSIRWISFSVHSFVDDPGFQGVSGHEFLFAFTENDTALDRTGAIAHSPIIVRNLLGAEDENGDGIIDFAESNLWNYTLDLAPDEITIGRTDLGGTDLTGNGLFNCGYVFGYRQPGVAEGDGLIDRFPELDFEWFRNPAGLDPQTFPNIVNVGTALAHPSWNHECYDDFDGSGTQPQWPQVPGCDDAEPYPIGAWDMFAMIDSVGNESGVFYFGGFTCSPPNPPPSPPFNQPWANPFIQFSARSSFRLCSDADIAEPFGILDLADIALFVFCFQNEGAVADRSPPFGIWDLADISAFVTAFLIGCP